jgi:hypothetical protein
LSIRYGYFSKVLEVQAEIRSCQIPQAGTRISSVTVPISSLYADYVLKCAGAGRRAELTGGGLIRSAGGWRAIRAAYEAFIQLTSDERILGGSAFGENCFWLILRQYVRA